MAYELVYTSAPEGLSRGSSGFCVVACTKGLGPRLIVTLEGLSAYKPLYPHYAPNAWENPISRTHYIYESNGEKQHILSRICFNGVDHTQRSNKLASHLVLSEKETLIAQGGPSSLLLHEELFKDASWPIKAESFPRQKEIPSTSVQIQKCSRWESVMGDAGWAGYLAQTYIDSPNKNVYIAYRPEQNKDVLPLIHEAMSLLPDELRWKVTFNTYFVTLPAGMSCSWRCCPADSDAIRAAKRSPMNIIIDITKHQTLEKDCDLITIARTGIIERQEEISTVPHSIQSEKPENSTKTGKIVRPPKLNLPKAGLHNKTTNLRSPRIEDFSGDTKIQKFDDDSASEYENDTPATQGRIKLAVSIVAIICLLSVFVYAIVYFVAVKKENQTYLVQSGEYKKLREAYDGAKSRGDEVRRKKTSARTEKQVNGLIEEVKELEQVIDSIKKAAEKLLPYQNLFEKRQQEVASEIMMDDTPRRLVEACDTLKKDLIRELSSLDTRLTEIRKLQAKIAETKKSIQDTKNEKALSSASQEKTLLPQIPTKGTEKKPEKAAEKVPIDDRRFLWTKSDPFHKMTQNGNMDIFVGAVDPGKITIFLIPNMSGQKVGTKLQCEPDQYDHRAVIETKFDEKKGALSFILTGTYAPPNDTEILIKIGNEAILPLYFRLDVSKIKPISRNQDNLKIEIGEEIKISLNSSAMQFPKLFYTVENSQCRPSPTLWIKCPSYNKFELRKQGNQFVYVGTDAEMKTLTTRVRALATVEKEMRDDPARFAKQLGDKLEKELKAYLDASIVVDDDKIRLKIEKLFSKDAKVPPAPKELREKIRKDPKKIPEKNKKMHEWVAKYDSMQNAAELLVLKLKDVPLKDLGYSSYQGSLSEEKARADKKFQDRKKVIETAIRASTVVLVYGDQDYTQFPIKDLLQ